MDQIVINSLVIIASISILVRSGVYVVRSLDVIAKFFNASQFTIAFIVMAFATSLPELAVGINAAITDSANISLGNILGTNIVNITLVLGLVGMIAGKVSMEDGEKFDTTKMFSFMLVMSPVLLMIDGTLSRIDGMILLLLFAWNLDRLFHIRHRLRDKQIIKKWFSRNKVAPEGKGLEDVPGQHKESLIEEMEEAEEVVISLEHFFKNLFVFIASTAFLIGSSYAAVYSAKNLSLVFGIPEILIGIFVIGLGTSLPELVFGIQSVNNGSSDMSIGNIFGSSVINSTLILGITALIRPIVMHDPGVFWVSGIAMAVTMLIAYEFFRTKHFMVRKEATALVFVYVIFLIVQMTIGVI